MQVLPVNGYSNFKSENWLIIGAGLAGALVAREAMGQGIQVTVCDPCPGRNAPPGGIVHPYPGRRFVQNVYEVDAFAYARRFYADLALKNTIDVKTDLPVVRPAEADIMNKNAVSEEKFGEKYLDRSEIEQLWPRLNVSSGAFTYSAGMVVNVQSMVNALLSESSAAGASMIPFSVACLERRDTGWHACGEFGEVGPFSSVVCAVGSDHTSLLACAGASRNFGSIALYAPDGRDEDYQVIISSRGHFAPLPGGGYLVGSTYIHLPNRERGPAWDDIDEAGHLDAIRKRLLRMQHSDAIPVQLWHGSRATVPQDKQPAVGLLTSSAECGLWMIGGLASRGLFWAPWLASRLVGAMLAKSADSLPGEFSPRRLKGFDGRRFEERSVQVR